MAVNLNQEPAWYRDRHAGRDWDTLVSQAREEHDTRNALRDAMTRDLLAACAVVQRGHDWTLRDCEAFSIILEGLAVTTARIRASVAREEQVR